MVSICFVKVRDTLEGDIKEWNSLAIFCLNVFYYHVKYTSSKKDKKVIILDIVVLPSAN